MPPRYLLLALLLATLLALILFPPPAHAGTYDVYSCRLPDGSPAPTDGWTPFATREPEVDVAAEAVDRCASGEALIARLGFGFWRLGATAGWSFNESELASPPEDGSPERCLSRGGPPGAVLARASVPRHSRSAQTICMRVAA
jgi:hypothetical protein